GNLLLMPGALPTNAAVTIGAHGSLNINSGSQTIGSLSGSGSANLGASTLTIGTNNASTTYFGVINGSGGVTKAGTGTLTFRGDQANAYTGATDVLNGTLALGKTIFVHLSPFGDSEDNNAIVGNLNIGSNAAGAPQAFVVDLAPEQLADSTVVNLAV